MQIIERKFGIIPRCLVAFVAIVVGGEFLLVYAAKAGDPDAIGSCCQPQICGDQQAIDCIPECDPGLECGGGGGCDPMWVKAMCVEKDPSH